jgi:cytochrome d ubiquinol oxidase subunit I
VTILGWARLVTAATLAVHALFVVFGVAMPLLISLAELLAMVRRDDAYRVLAQRWAKGFLLTFAIGAATGTIVAAELSVVWPNFMRVVGQTIALPFLIEVIAFFLESAFLGVWLYGWDRFRRPIHHWLTSLPVVVAGPASATLITLVNAFMNDPSGFAWSHGHVVWSHPWVAMFSPGWGVEVLHVLASAFTATGFGIAGWTAYSLLRAPHPYLRRQLHLATWTGLVGVVASVITGDLEGKFLAHAQPLKLAAMEGLFRTQAYAPLTLGGVASPSAHGVVGGIALPGLLSFLAYGSFSHPVRGLNSFARNLWPPLVIHVFFDLMVVLGIFLLVVGAVYVLAPRLRETVALRWLLALGAPFSFAAMELGWMVDELGRQPYILYGVLTVSQAVTSSPALPWVAVTVLVLLAFALVGTVYGALRLYRGSPLPAAGTGPVGEERQREVAMG